MLCQFQTTWRDNKANRIGWTKRKTISVSRLQEHIQRAWSEKNECYNSIHCIDKLGVSRYPLLVLDIDSKDLELARQSLLTLLYGLNGEGDVEHAQAYFSGSKGFHLYVSSFLFVAGEHTEQSFGPRVQKQLAHRLNDMYLRNCDAKIDTLAIGTNRIIRSVNSINFKSGLYKIPLSPKDVELGITEIQKLARQPKFKSNSNIDDNNMYVFRTSAPVAPKEELLALYAEALSACVAPVEDICDKKAAVRSRRTELPRSGTKKPKLFYLTDVVVDKCRALRQLRRGCIERGKVSAKERFLLSTILTETKSRSSYIHSFLSLFDGYSKQITDKKLTEKRLVCNCEMAAEEHLCSSTCSKYIKDDMAHSRLPAYFGVTNRTVWVQATTPDSVIQTAFKLRRYHETTTDLFDWNNCLQFINDHDVHSHIVSDNLRRGKLPALNNFLINVPKGDGKTRQLTLCPFEVELMTSITVPLILRENCKRKLKHRVENNVFSFGFQHLPVSPTDIVLPWLEEYTRFKDALVYCASQKERYPLTFTDDIVNFYPSISNERLSKLIKSYRFDPRAKALLLEFINGTNYVSIESGEAVEFQGLSQGPLITHILASTLLIEIDVAFAKAFTSNEAILVRYVDDIHVFCRDENVLRRFKTELIPALQDELDIKFHSAVDQISEKCFQGSTADYLLKRLKQDLQKYEIKFKAELARMGKEEMEEFFRLLDNLFGVTYRNILSADPTINLKELERQLSSLTWKARGILKEGEQATEGVLRLKQTLLKILGLSEISWKFQTTVLMLYLALTRAFEDYTSGSEICESKTLDTNYGLFVNLSFQVIKQLCSTVHSEMRILAERLTKLCQLEHTEIIRSLLSDTVLLCSTTRKIEMGVASWNYHSDHPKDWSVGYFLSEYFATFRDGGFEKIDLILNQAESEFSFYKNLLLRHFDETHQSWDKGVLLQIYRIALHYDISELASRIIDEPGMLESVAELGGVYKVYGFWIKNYFESAVRRILGFVNDAEISVLKSEKGYRIIRIGKDVSCVESIHIKNELEKSLYEGVLILLRGLADVKYDFEVEGTILMLITNLGSVGSNTLTPYLSDASRANEILLAESKFLSDAGENQEQLRRLIIPASCLVISNGRLKIHTVAPILLSTIESVYTYQNNEKDYIEEGRLHMPGLRIAEFCRNQVRHNRDIVDDPVFEKMVNFINSKFKYADINKSFTSIVDILDSLISYLGTRSAMALDGVKYSEIYQQCYSLAKDITRNPPNACFRRLDNPQCRFYNLLLSRCCALSRVLVQTKEKGGSLKFQELMRQQENLKQLQQLRKIATYNVYFAANMVFAFRKCRKQCSRKDHVEPVLVILGLGIYYYFCAALEEVQNFFTFDKKQLNDLGSYLNQFFGARNQEILRNHFVYPTLTNFAPLAVLLKQFDEVDFSLLNRLKPEGSLECLGVNKITFRPDPLDAETIADSFTDVRVFAETKRRGLIGAFHTFFKPIAEKVGYVTVPHDSHQLYKVCSFLQDWSHENITYIERYSFVTASKSGYQLSYGHKTNQTLSPEAFESCKLFLPLYRRNLFLGLAIVLILSLGGYMLKTQIREQLLGLPERLVSVFSKHKKHEEVVTPQATKDPAAESLNSGIPAKEESATVLRVERSLDETPKANGPNVQTEIPAEDSGKVENLEYPSENSSSGRKMHIQNSRQDGNEAIADSKSEKLAEPSGTAGR